MGMYPQLCFVASCCLAAVAGAQHGGAQEGKLPEAPDELFRSRCVDCHVPPDPRFAVERAWLEQVLDTA